MDTVSLPVLSASSSGGSDAAVEDPLARLPGDPWKAKEQPIKNAKAFAVGRAGPSVTTEGIER